jgi:hypothetical protein
VQTHLDSILMLGFLSAFPCAAAEPQTEDAVVKGQVVAADGSQVQSAQITAIPITTSGHAGHLQWTNTDGHGQFHLVLKPGRYQIRAKAEADGYPDPNALFSVDPSARFPTITVAQSDISGVQVVLGAKGGILVGDLRDRQSHGAIPHGTIILRDARDPKAFVELTADGQGRFQFTVPNKAFTILATASEYETVQFQNGQTLLLSNGERRNITIELDHKPD